MNLQKNKHGFTLIEIMLSMTIFAIIMVAVLLSIQNLSLTRAKTENRVKLLEELYFFSEKLVTQIKEGGTVDYEEYWNRKTYGTLTENGSYSGATGMGNYGRGGIIGTTTYGSDPYYCVSGSGSRMGTGGCTAAIYNSEGFSQTLTYQRYGQYALQFIDYNSNADEDDGDEDGNGSLIDDEDDKDIGNAPIVFSGTIPELYLINPREKTRLFFRYVARQDPATSTVCEISPLGNTNDGCIGNVQVLKMLGRDIGYNHSGGSLGSYDGNIDTWILHPDWTGTGPLLPIGRLATGESGEWVDLFPNNVNVKHLSFLLYPQKDPWLSWDAQDCNTVESGCISPFIHPYVRLQMTLGFAHGKRRILKDDNPTISVNTTITLSDNE